MGGMAMSSLLTSMGSSIVSGVGGMADSVAGTMGNIIDGAKNFGENVTGTVADTLNAGAEAITGKGTQAIAKNAINQTKEIADAATAKPLTAGNQGIETVNNGIQQAVDASKSAMETVKSANKIQDSAFGKGLLSNESILAKDSDGNIDWGDTLLSAGGRFLQNRALKPITGAAGGVLKMSELMNAIGNKSTEKEDDEVEKKKKKENKGV